MTADEHFQFGQSTFIIGSQSAGRTTLLDSGRAELERQDRSAPDGQTPPGLPEGQS